MLILPTTPSGTTIFCDDVRHEITGKFSLIGVYQDGMTIVGEVPVLIPQLCLVTKVRLDQKSLPFSFLLKMIFEDERLEEETIQEMSLSIPAVDENLIHNPDTVFSDKEGIQYAQFQTEARLLNFPISKSGRIKVRMFEGDNEIALGSIRILLAPQNNVAETNINKS